MVHLHARFRIVAANPAPAGTVRYRAPGTLGLLRHASPPDRWWFGGSSAVDRNLAGCFEGESDLVATDHHYLDANVLADDDLLILLTAEDQHRESFLQRMP